MSADYPWIPKEYYAAVMFACKIIKEKKTFNKAINAAAKYYHVDKTELERHVRARQGAGQKGTTKKYKWYAVQFCKGSEYYNVFDAERAYWTVIKATSEANAIKQIWNNFDPYGVSGFDGEWPLFGETVEFQTREQATEYVGRKEVTA